MPKPLYTDVIITCHACAAKLKVRRGREGLVYKCPKCNEVLDFEAPTNAPFAEPGFEPTARVRFNNPEAAGEGYNVSPEVRAQLGGPVEKREDIPVVCPLCHTRLYARKDQVGQSITCPDCRRLIVVRPPPEKAVKRAAVSADLGNEYKVREGVDQPASDSAAAHKYFSFSCPLCHTRMSATDEQVGQSIKCPDCHRPVEVKRPPPPAPKRRWTEDDGVEIPIEATFERPAVVVVPLRERDVPAEVKVKRSVSEAPDLPSWPLVRGVVTFPLQREMWPYLLGYGAWLAGLIVILHLILSLIYAGSVIMIGAVLLLKLFAIGFGLWWFATSSLFLTIVQDSSEGLERVESWPDSVLLASEFSDPFFSLNAAAMACAAGGLLMTSLGGITAEGAAIVGLLATTALFPLFMLSMLANDSPLFPFSSPVWKGVGRSLGSWLAFYLETTAVVAATIGVGALGWIEGDILSLTGVGMAIFAALLIYYRALGRLAWITALADDEDVDDAEDEYDSAQAMHV